MTNISERRGLWIAFEGTDGCGKSTQAKKLAETIEALLTWEPGNTAIGEMIRYVLLNQRESMTFRCEALLFAADRAEHVHSIVRPSLEKGVHVVSDRSIWSSVIYQGIGRGLGADKILEIGTWASDNITPDIVVHLRSNPRKALEKIATPDRIESEGYEFMQKVEEGFRQAANKHNWISIDSGTIDEVNRNVEKLVLEKIKQLTTNATF
jgi:dTMP kinase